MERSASELSGGFSVVALFVAAGILMPSGANEGSAVELGEEGFPFDWFPEDGDYSYMLQASPGDTDCRANHTIEGTFTHESGMGAYGFSERIGSSSIRRDDSVHAGPLNSGHVTGPVWADAANARYGSSPRISGPDWFWVRAAFATVEPREPLQVTCSGSDAGLRFYQADAFEPILSSTSTGGVGAELWNSFFPEEIGVNKADRYSITTEGEYVVLDLRDSPKSGSEDTRLKYEVRIHSPEGTEVVPLDVEGSEQFGITREWSSEGTYTVEIDRFSKNRSPLRGLLAGFVLEEELGEPFPLP